MPCWFAGKPTLFRGSWSSTKSGLQWLPWCKDFVDQAVRAHCCWHRRIIKYSYWMLLSVIAVLLWAIDLIIAFEQRLRSWNKAMASLNEKGISCDSYGNFWSRNNFATAIITMRQSPSRTSDQAHSGINHCNPPKRSAYVWTPHQTDHSWPGFRSRKKTTLQAPLAVGDLVQISAESLGLLQNRCYSMPLCTCYKDWSESLEMAPILDQKWSNQELG